MTERLDALKYLDDHTCIRRNSKRYRHAKSEINKARNPLDRAENICVGWKREKAQAITSDIWDAHPEAVSLQLIDELERALRKTLGGRIDPTHHRILNELNGMVRDHHLTRGVFVKRGAELFRMAAYVPDAGGKLEWREPDIRGFSYQPSLTTSYPEKYLEKSVRYRGVLQVAPANFRGSVPQQSAEPDTPSDDLARTVAGNSALRVSAPHKDQTPVSGPSVQGVV